MFVPSLTRMVGRVITDLWILGMVTSASITRNPAKIPQENANKLGKALKVNSSLQPRQNASYISRHVSSHCRTDNLISGQPDHSSYEHRSVQTGDWQEYRRSEDARSLDLFLSVIPDAEGDPGHNACFPKPVPLLPTGPGSASLHDLAGVIEGG